MQRVKWVLKLLLGVAFVGAGINHFISPAFYVKLMPSYIPYHSAMVALSGVTEIVAGVMLLVPATTRWGAWFIVAHLIAFFPVHIWMIQRQDTLYKDVPLVGLWLRLAFQFVFIAWAAWYVRDGKGEAEAGA